MGQHFTLGAGPV